MTEVRMKRDSARLGEVISFEQFARLSHEQIWNDLTYAGCCGAHGVLFKRDDGSLALEDADSVYIQRAEAAR